MLDQDRPLEGLFFGFGEGQPQLDPELIDGLDQRDALHDPFDKTEGLLPDPVAGNDPQQIEKDQDEQEPQARDPPADELLDPSGDVSIE